VYRSVEDSPRSSRSLERDSHGESFVCGDGGGGCTEVRKRGVICCTPAATCNAARRDIKPAGDLQTRNLIFASEETTANNQFLLATKGMAFRCKLMTRARTRERSGSVSPK